MLELPASGRKRSALFGLSAFFVVAGANHFLDPAFYLAMMPPWLPAHRELVGVSGAFEVLGGVGVLIPATRRAAGRGLVLLLAAVFPANLFMALHPELFPDIPTAALYLRLPVQGLFMAWTVWATRPDDPPTAPSTGTL